MRSEHIFPKGFEFYPVLTLLHPNEERILSAFDQLVDAGVRIIQLRDKTLSGPALECVAQSLVKRAHSADVRFIVNDHAELAARIGADGVHLGRDDRAIHTVRVLGLSIIGISTHTPDDARVAEAEGADYIGVGPIFTSPTKPERTPIGIKGLESIRKAVSLPIAAIGGITPETAQACLDAGADTVCSISGIFGAPDIRDAARHFLEKTTRVTA